MILIIVVVLLAGVAVYFVFIKGQFDIKEMYIQCPVILNILKEKKQPLANTFNIYITIESNIFKRFFHLLYLLLIISFWLFSRNFYVFIRMLLYLNLSCFSGELCRTKSASTSDNTRNQQRSLLTSIGDKRVWKLNMQKNRPLEKK